MTKSYVRTQIKKSENRLQLKLKILRVKFLKIPKPNKGLKKYSITKKSCKEASSKNSKNGLQLTFQNIQNDIFYFKIKKITPKKI